MYIRTDDNNNIIELIIVGGKPEVNGYEVDEIDEAIMRDILNYKYIDGEFVKSDDDFRNRYIDMIRQIKINNMSSLCHACINKGIDYNGDHYSLTTTDQINLMKLESIARFSPETTLLYHADGKDCRVYSNEEIIEIATIGIGLITFHTTYFNQLKSQINDMSNIDEIINVKYGMTLDESYKTQFELLTNGLPFVLEEIVDTFDYESLIPKVNEEAIQKVLTPPPSIPEPETPPTTDEENIPPTDVDEPIYPTTDPENTEPDDVDEVEEYDPTPYEPDIEVNVDDHEIVDMVIPDTSTDVEWEEEVPEEVTPETGSTDDDGSYEDENTTSDESEVVTDEETDTELPV